MHIRPIHTETDHAEALVAIFHLMDINPEPGTVEFDRLEVLATLVEAYEARIAPIGFPNPIAAIEARLIDKGLSRRALAGATGIAESKISEVMRFKRPLSINMIRSIGPILDLPLGLLVQPYPVSEPVHARGGGRGSGLATTG